MSSSSSSNHPHDDTVEESTEKPNPIVTILQNTGLLSKSEKNIVKIIGMSLFSEENTIPIQKFNSLPNVVRNTLQKRVRFIVSHGLVELGLCEVLTLLDFISPDNKSNIILSVINICIDDYTQNNILLLNFLINNTEIGEEDMSMISRKCDNMTDSMPCDLILKTKEL